MVVENDNIMCKVNCRSRMEIIMFGCDDMLTGILLYSAPGCAKTTLVRAIAASHQTNFLSVSAAELFSSAVGDSEKIVADLFHRARMASPCILFIDELGTN